MFKFGFIFHLLKKSTWICVGLAIIGFSCQSSSSHMADCSTSPIHPMISTVSSLIGTYVGTYRYKEIRSYSADKIQIDPDQVLILSNTNNKDIQVDFLDTNIELCFVFEDSDSLYFEYSDSDFCCSTLYCRLTIYKKTKQIRYRYHKTYTASGHFSATEKLFYD